MHISKTVMRFFITLATGFFAVGAAQAEPSEDERLKQCDRDLCGIVQSKSVDGDALSCNLSKSWEKDEIVKALSKSKISWSYGNAKCSIKIDLERALLVSGLAAGKNTVKFPSQTIDCEIVNDGKPQPVVVKATPKILFKDGKASTVWLNVESIEAPAMIRTAIWTATKMEANFGTFQKDILKGVNDFMVDHCPKTYPKK